MIVTAILRDDGFLEDIQDNSTCLAAPEDKCECGGRHFSRPPGTTRVVLAEFPTGCGPFRYDPATNRAIENAERKILINNEKLIKSEIRAMAIERLKARGDYNGKQ